MNFFPFFKTTQGWSACVFQAFQTVSAIPYALLYAQWDTRPSCHSRSKSICSLDCPGYGVLSFLWHLLHYTYTNKTICVRAKATNYSEKCGSVGSNAVNGLFFLFCHNPFLTLRRGWSVEVSVLKSRLSMLQREDTMHFQFVLIFYGFHSQSVSFIDWETGSMREVKLWQKWGATAPIPVKTKKKPSQL